TITAVIITTAVSRRVGIVVAPVGVWRPPVSAPAGNDRSGSGAKDKRAQVPRCVARLNSTVWIRALCYVGDVVNRRARRNRVNLLRNRRARGPWPLRIGRHEPYALKAKVIDISNFDYLVLGIRSISHRCSLNRL